VNWAQSRDKIVPVDPVGVAAIRDGRPGTGKEENVLTPPLGSFFEAPQPGPPEETRLGRGGFLTPLYPRFPPFFTTPRSPPIAGGVDQFTQENHIKLKNAGILPALTQGLYAPVKEEAKLLL
jgi:hypothetical protein